MKTSTALFITGLLLVLPMPVANAGDEPPVPALPQGYDLMTLSRGPAKAIPGLELPKDNHVNETATILTVVPADGDGTGTRIEWSGRVTTGVVYKNTRKR